MPAPFRRFDVAQFAELVRAFKFQREITSFHVHHTWIPRRSDFNGVKSIEAMDRHHRLVRGFSDIAQHITLDPDGFIWSGRSWNSPPASALGFNGNGKAGPFMMEMVGDFDTGEEPFDGAQADNAYRVVAIILKHFKLRPDAIRFHNEMSTKTCPGTSIDKKVFIQNVAAAMKALPAESDASDPELLAQALTGLLEPLERAVAPRAADADAELPEDDETYADYVARTEAEFDGGLAGARAADSLTPAQLAALAPHVVNLRRGKFSDDDLFVSNEGTVDAIFAGLDAQLQNASPQNPVKLLFLAHGGLVSERGALAKAHRDLWFWKNNGIYPIFFVWQTSLGTAFRDIIARSREGARDIDFFTIPDRIVEGFVRHFGGVEAWDSMKLSAAESSATGGGALYVVTKLQALVAAHGNSLELHAFGHSAGANFHAHFLNAANVPFQSLHLLAPAIRIDEYTRRLDPLLDPAQIGRVHNPVIYTMRDKLESADMCTRAYHKSLLYLISRGLEDQRDTPILGMERFLTKDAVVARRFGITPGGAGSVGRVFFSPSAQTKATAHGCFDDDIATMNSIVTAIRGSAPAKPYENTGAGKCTQNSVFAEPRELPEELERELARALPAPPPGLSPASLLAAAGRALSIARATGRRRALCVGINTYPSDPLHGCVADAENWARTLVALGFETPIMLLDSVATRQAILDTLTRLLESSASGDTVVFQYSGHGTEVRDLDGDELSVNDQAICPVNFRDGELLIDDDVAAILARTPPGVAVTCFLDNCFSGTGTRFAIGQPSAARAAGDLPRFVVADERLEERHAIFRRTNARAARAASSRGPDTMREVVFSACRSDEVAWESNGQGDFTRNAIALLTSNPQVTNAQFQDSLVRGFTPSGRQHPTLDCASSAESASLFAFGGPASPIVPTLPPTAKPTFPAPPPGTAVWLRELAAAIDR